MSSALGRFLATLRGGRLLLAVVLALALLVALGRAVASAYVDSWK
jgi:hypothetical protein